MRPEGLRLDRLHRRLVYGVSVAVTVTGLLWLLFHHLVRVDGPFGDVAHPLESQWLRLHGAAAMLWLLVLGSLVRGHIRAGWKSKRNRVSGTLTTSITGVLIATGWALYYVSHEGAREWVSTAHWTIGVMSAVVLAAHVVLGHRSRPRVAPKGAGHHHRRPAPPPLQPDPRERQPTLH